MSEMTITEYLGRLSSPVSTRHLAVVFGRDIMELFHDLNAEAKRGTLVRGMALEPNPNGNRDILCIGWSCPAD